MTLVQWKQDMCLEFSSSGDGFVVLPPRAVTLGRSKQPHKNMDRLAWVRGVGGSSDLWYSHAGYPLLSSVVSFFKAQTFCFLMFLAYFLAISPDYTS